MSLFKRVKSLGGKELHELSVLCGGVAVLVAVALFVSSGGVERAVIVAERLTDAHGQTASVSATQIGNWVYSMSLSPDSATVLQGGSLTFNWQAYRYAGNHYYPVCDGYREGDSLACSITAGHPDYSSGCHNNWINPSLSTGDCGNVVPAGGDIIGGAYTVYPSPGRTTYYFCSNYLHSQAGFGCLVSNVFVPPTPTTLTSFTASPTSIASGAPLTLAWSGTRGTFYSSCSLSGGGWGSGTVVSGTTNSIPNQVQISGPNTTTTYGVQCYDSYYGWVGPRSATVTVQSASLAAVAADATATSPVRVGQTATISFHADSSDAPTKCQVNNSDDTVALKIVSGGCPSSANTTYTTPAYSAPGTYGYKFYYYRNGWTLVKTITVQVNPVSCPAGQILNAAGDACVPGCSNGLGAIYAPSCTCPAGQRQSGAVCVVIPTSCSNGLGPTYLPGCVCPSGQVQSGASCVAPGAIRNFSANPVRVRKGQQTTLTWSTSNMTTCALKGPDTTGAIQTLSTQLNGTLAPTIAGQSIYTLTCVDGAGTALSQSTTVNLIPETIEQ